MHFIQKRRMKMAERDEFGAFLIGFIVGGLTGAVAALLMAPQSGEETRTVIKEKAIELKDRASQNLDEAYAQAEAAAAEARARFEELAVMTKERAEELQRKGQVILEEQKAKLERKLPGEETPGDMSV
jgi:gas vesicle protein